MNWPCSAPSGWASARTRSCGTRRFSPGCPPWSRKRWAPARPRRSKRRCTAGAGRYLEELETGTQFDLGRLIVYRLKLLLLERKDQFRPEPGLESFAESYARVLDDAAAWTSAAGPAIGNGERT